MNHFSKLFIQLGLVVLTIMLSASLVFSYSKKTVDPNNLQEVRSTMVLKQYMQKFGILVAGIELLKLKEKKPDWEAIHISLVQMEKTLNQMQVADQYDQYSEFIDQLGYNLKVVQKLEKKKDQEFFNAFENLTQTCFKCHAAHRPSDYYLPKKGDPRVSERPQARLWQVNAN